MKFDNNLNFQKALLGFINKVGANCAQAKMEWKIEEADKDIYNSYMKSCGFDPNEIGVPEAFERLLVVDLKKEKKRIITNIKRLESASYTK